RDAIAAQPGRTRSATQPVGRGGPSAAARASTQHRADRRGGVAGDRAGPDEFPQCRFELLLADLTTCKALRELPEEEGPAAGQRVQDRLVGRGLLDRGGGTR